eukprot:scaffold60580_cov66-Phaeocystis_antarctica.AAC.1
MGGVACEVRWAAMGSYCTPRVVYIAFVYFSEKPLRLVHVMDPRWPLNLGQWRFNLRHRLGALQRPQRRPANKAR